MMMLSAHLIFPVVIALSLVSFQSVIGCPTFCSCNAGTVDCSHKRSIQIEADKIPKTTKRLDYSNNQLSKITRNHFQGLNLLESLHLHQNKITAIEDDSFKDLANLTSLFLNGNKISSITKSTLRGLFKLESLLMENLNQGSQHLKIADGAFSDLNNLEVLILNDNKMQHFSDDTFKGLNNLKYLSFNFGMVSSISSKALDMFPTSLRISNKGRRKFKVCCCSTAKALSRFPSVKTSCKLNACIETSDVCSLQTRATTTTTTSVIPTTSFVKSSSKTTNVFKESTISIPLQPALPASSKTMMKSSTTSSAIQIKSSNFENLVIQTSFLSSTPTAETADVSSSSFIINKETSSSIINKERPMVYSTISPYSRSSPKKSSSIVIAIPSLSIPESSSISATSSLGKVPKSVVPSIESSYISSSSPSSLTNNPSSSSTVHQSKVESALSFQQSSKIKRSSQVIMISSLQSMYQTVSSSSQSSVHLSSSSNEQLMSSDSSLATSTLMEQNLSTITSSSSVQSLSMSSIPMVESSSTYSSESPNIMLLSSKVIESSADASSQSMISSTSYTLKMFSSKIESEIPGVSALQTSFIINPSSASTHQPLHPSSSIKYPTTGESTGSDSARMRHSFSMIMIVTLLAIITIYRI